jgi:hypothetical protein
VGFSIRNRTGLPITLQYVTVTYVAVGLHFEVQVFDCPTQARVLWVRLSLERHTTNRMWKKPNTSPLKSPATRFHGELCDVLRAADADPLLSPPAIGSRAHHMNIPSHFAFPSNRESAASPATRPLPPLPHGIEPPIAVEHSHDPIYASLLRPQGS